VWEIPFSVLVDSKKPWGVKIIKAVSVTKYSMSVLIMCTGLCELQCYSTEKWLFLSQYAAVSVIVIAGTRNGTMLVSLKVFFSLLLGSSPENFGQQFCNRQMQRPGVEKTGLREVLCGTFGCEHEVLRFVWNHPTLCCLGAHSLKEDKTMIRGEKKSKLFSKSNSEEQCFVCVFTRSVFFFLLFSGRFFFQRLVEFMSR